MILPAYNPYLKSYRPKSIRLPSVHGHRTTLRRLRPGYTPVNYDNKRNTIWLRDMKKKSISGISLKEKIKIITKCV